MIPFLLDRCKANLRQDEAEKAVSKYMQRKRKREEEDSATRASLSQSVQGLSSYLMEKVAKGEDKETLKEMQKEKDAWLKELK